MQLERPSADPRIADLARTGRIRFAVFPPQYGKDTAGALTGPWVDVMRALAEWAGVTAEFSEVADPGALVASLADGGCDIGSLGFDPTRAGSVEGFSPPFMQVDYTYLVRPGSALRIIADVDQAGVRIAAVRLHASTLALQRTLRRAAPLEVDTLQQAFNLLRAGEVQAWASIRPSLLEHAAALPGSAVLDGCYGANRPALVTPRGTTARLSFVSEFVERSRSSGELDRIIARHPGYRPPS
jgi:polar amino acid transport system substrate-binding protein